jgi:RING finger protein 113A
VIIILGFMPNEEFDDMELFKKKKPRGLSVRACSQQLEEPLEIKDSTVMAQSEAAADVPQASYSRGLETDKKYQIEEEEPKTHSGRKTSYIPKTGGFTSSVNPDNSKPTCRFDFAKDLCKDYNETGYCVFGDTCIFLHDRGDYKSGWELELEWNENMKKGQGKDPKATENPLPDRADEKSCFVCSKEFVSPVVAECGDKFCESCALGAFSKSQKCPKCKKSWNGSFRGIR